MSNMSGPHWHAQPLDGDHVIKINQEIHVSPKALNIIWGNDSRYWQWTLLQKNESNFPHGAELLQVNWIEVTGKLDFSHLRPNEEYEIVYVLKFKVDAFGWHSCPIKFKATTTDGQATEKSEMLESYRKVSETWHEVSGGEFKVNSTQEGAVHFGMYEIGSDWWKGSMILKEVKIRPKVRA
ncbi:hypothetical protein MRB53_024579 [Persea americana]|uniref:Uncharacterized protein n=1 Tax=Persea americana TaxID=3435 RepID=A0ACC2LCU1_PERAE|nr:hypothetical protein MRB53_024579 [Persea americana]